MPGSAQCQPLSHRCRSRLINTANYPQLTILVVYREPVTGPRSPGIVHRRSAINNNLAPKPAPKPTPKPNPSPTLTIP